jgi:GNAT superfamily N-acetyltransferase
MTDMADRGTLTVRRYEDRDEPAVLELLTESLGGGPAGVRPAEFFRWKHLDNPFGRSFMLVAEDAGRVVGLRAFMRWRFVFDGGEVRAARAVDTATHPDYQGRGIFTRLTLAALEELRGEADLIFNTPNDKSMPGYLKMGWQVMGTVPVSARIRHPLRVVRGRRTVGNVPGASADIPVAAMPAAEALRDDASLGSLLDERAPSHALETPLDLAFLRWRYGSAPLLDYRAVRLVSGGRLRGLAFFRARTRGTLREATIADVVVEPGDVASAARLLARVGRTGSFDHVACSFARGTDAARAARRAAFLPAGRGVTVVVNELRTTAAPEPRRPESWRFVLGDLEVF